jgi:hypothetical protein
MSEELFIDVKGLKTRVQALEEVVNDVLLPKLGHTEEKVNDIHARVDEVHVAFMTPETGIKARHDRMYESYVMAENGVKMIGKIGNGFVRVSDMIEKRPKTILMLVGAGILSFSAGRSGALPEWVEKAIRWMVA